MLTNYRSLSRTGTQIMPLNVKRARSASAVRKTSKRTKSAIVKAVTNYKPGGIMYNLTGDPVPSAYRTKMKYVDQAILVSSAAGEWEYQFNLNSLYDPNRSQTGHQPLGYDQLAALYQRYRVLTTKVAITNFSPASSNVAGWWTFVVDTTTSTSIVNIVERARYAKVMPANPNNGANKLNQKFDMAAVVGCSPIQYQSDDRYSAVVGSNPTETIIGHLIGQQSTTTGSSLYVLVQLEFYCEFYDPVEQIQS